MISTESKEQGVTRVCDLFEDLCDKHDKFTEELPSWAGNFDQDNEMMFFTDTYFELVAHFRDYKFKT